MNKSNTCLELNISSLLLLWFTVFSGCVSSNDNNSQSIEIKSISTSGYNLSDPDETIILPEILHEISGISVIDSSSVACIQDENGIVFIFDLTKQEIKKELVFHSDGDYEGISCVEKAIFILRSDGKLFEISDYTSADLKKKEISRRITGKDNEGLCYDQKSNRLLITPKYKTGKGSEYWDKHPVYGFDLNSGIFAEEPVILIDLIRIKKPEAFYKSPDPGNRKKKKQRSEPEIEFRPSDIGIHPLTNKLFVLSGTDKMLFVLDRDGRTEYTEKLNPDIFNMPEGISFLKNGDMLISNEGENKKPTLLRFNYKL